jgi:hypothetical protein
MSTLYQILGLPQGADEQQVKTAFRKLARCFHPDVNTNDAAAERRFKDISAAYKTLMDPHARAVYDRALVHRRDAAARRFRQMSTTATAAGALSISVALLILTWTQRAPSQQQNQFDEAAPAAAARMPGRGGSWATYRNRRFRFTLKYPADVFTVQKPTTDSGVELTSDNGEVKLRIFAAMNITGTTLADHRRFLVEHRYAGVRLEHTPQSKLWFVLSGSRGDRVVYEHVGFLCDGTSMYGWQMVYPAAQRTFYDLVADEIHRHTVTTSLRCGALPPLPHQNPVRRLPPPRQSPLSMLDP